MGGRSSRLRFLLASTSCLVFEQMYPSNCSLAKFCKSQVITWGVLLLTPPMFSFAKKTVYQGLS